MVSLFLFRYRSRKKIQNLFVCLLANFKSIQSFKKSYELEKELFAF